MEKDKGTKGDQTGPSLQSKRFLMTHIVVIWEEKLRGENAEVELGALVEEEGYGKVK